MAAAEATLTVRIRSVGERKLDTIGRKLDKISAKAAAAQASLNMFTKGYSNQLANKVEALNKAFKRHFDFVDKGIKALGNVLSKFLNVTLKATAVEFGVMAASMVVVHALFGTGRLLARAYHATLNVLAAGAAAAAVALASVAAALRENNAAMFAYKATGYKQFGANLNQVRVIMRGLESDSMLAAVGVKTLNEAYAAVSKSSTFNRGSQSLLKGLMDFASAGQPLEQGVKAAAELIGILQDPKASFGSISKAAEALGPAMTKAMEEAKKKGINTAAELKKAILDGSLSALGGVEGQFDAVNSTLVSIVKGGATQMRSLFADLGQPFLKPIKEAVDQMLVVIRRTFMRTYGELVKFGKGSFVDSLVGATEKLESLLVTLFRDYLPRAEGMMERLSSRWDKFVSGWQKFWGWLKPLEDGAKVILNLFKAIFGPVWDQIKEKFKTFNQQLQDNEEPLLAFGDSLGQLLVALSEITDKFRELFFQALPFITKLVDGLTQVVDLMKQLVVGFSGMMGGSAFGAFAAMMGIGITTRQMKNTRGGWISSGMAGAAQGGPVTGVTAAGQMSARNAVRMQAGIGGNMQPIVYPTAGGTGLRSQRAGRAAGGVGSASIPLAGRAGRPTMSPFQAAYQSPGMQGRLGSTFRGMRDRSAFMGHAARMNQSMGAKFGTMMGLGMLSGYMPEETQGAMGLGSMVGAFNPVLGLGVAGLGTALTSQNVGVGIGGGMVGGAAMGAFAGVPGMVVGAIVGGIAGGIKSKMNKTNALKETARAAAETASEAMMDGLRSGIAEAMANTDLGERKRLLTTREGLEELVGMDKLERLSGMSTGGTHEERQRRIRSNAGLLGLTPQQLEDALEKPKEFIETLVARTTPELKAGELFIDSFSMKLEWLERNFDMTSDEVMNLAAATGTDLYDAFQNTTDMVEQLAQGMIRTKQDLQNEFADVAAFAFTNLQARVAREEAPLILDEAGQNLLDASRAGELTSGVALEGLQSIWMGGLALTGGDPIMAMADFIQANTPRTGSGWQEGGFWDQFQGNGRGVMLEALGDVIGGMMGEMPELLKNTFTGFAAGQGLAIDQNAFDSSSMISALANNPGKWKHLTRILDPAYVEENGFEKVATNINTLFPGTNLTTRAIDPDENTPGDLGDITEATKTALTKLTTSFNAATRSLANIMSPGVVTISTPETVNISGISGTDGTTSGNSGDTTSSRFSKTMASHGKMDSMLSGKRNITSGWRNFGLGSPSSDHIMGRAFDLTGQNLGAYKQMVAADGGFAEFHGSAGDRHLHVVPNTNAIGDSSTTASMGVGASGGTTNNYSYTINVNGSDASPEQIATVVMERIKQESISTRERQ